MRVLLYASFFCVKTGLAIIKIVNWIENKYNQVYTGIIKLLYICKNNLIKRTI